MGALEPVQALLDGQAKFEVSPTNHSTSTFEFRTLEALQKHCQDRPDTWVLYIHNKGASRLGPIQTNMGVWRAYLEHFVLTRYRACLEVLRK